ncbi:hypothetical protein IL306_008247 [Fusarium sp. DS 682]|nr:hypothetical protein IL306_008247 [Fusarium sp. DS 682]
MPPRSDTHQPQTPERRDALYIIRKTRQRLRATDATKYEQTIDENSAEPHRLIYDREEILHQLRGLKEKQHRENICILFARLPLHWNLPVGQDEPDWDLKHRYCGLEHLIDCHNKSTAIYLFDPEKKGSDLHRGGVLYSVDVWLYRQWFEPYESDIEYARYIAKPITLGLEPGATEPALTDINDFHQKLIHGLSPNALRCIPSGMLQNLLISSFPPPSEQADEKTEDLFAALSKHHVLKPLFKSLFIVLHQTQVRRTDPFTAEEIDNLPVSLVQTGSTEGLSKPISFHSLHRGGHVLSDRETLHSSVCSVRTTLKPAIKFIMDLERRERAALKSKPAPSLADHTVDIKEEARKLGWDEARHGRLPLDQLSSTWVNRRKYPEWTGPGALKHLQTMFMAIRFRKSMNKYTLEDDWWWWETNLDSTQTGTKAWIRQGPAFISKPLKLSPLILFIGNLIIMGAFYLVFCPRVCCTGA